MNKTTINIIKYSLILILVIAPFFVFSNVSHADSGWDTGYSGGSSGGSSSSSSSSSWSSSSSSSSSSSGKSWSEMNIFEKIFVALFGGIAVLVWVAMMLSGIFIFLSSIVKGIKNLIYHTYHSIAGYRNDVDEKKFKQLLPEYSMSDLKEELYQKFIDIQNAWMEIDYDKLRDLCTDELYNTYHSQLRVLELKHGKNIMNGFKKREIKITNVRKSEEYITVNLYLRVSFKDYVINTKNNKVTAGTKFKKITNHYDMDFVIAVDPKPVTKCPNCGAKINLVTSGTCDHCKGMVVVPPKEFVLSKKKNNKTTR